MNAIHLDATWLEACLDLDQAALNGFWSPDQWRRELADDRRLCFGLSEGEALIGVACGWLVVDELHITVVAVDPRHRRRGHARALLQALLQRARQDGAVHATLEVASDNEAALNLYGRCGFRSAGCREGYYRDGRDALIQWCRLQDDALSWTT